MECALFIYIHPIYLVPLYSSPPLQFDLDQASSRYPLLFCVMFILFFSVLSPGHMSTVSFIPSEALLKIHISYGIPPTIISLAAIWVSLLSLFSIFRKSYLRKCQCYLQSLSAGFADRENGGDHIRLGHGLWRMTGCECIRLHLQNLICSQCKERTLTSQWKWV